MKKLTIEHIREQFEKEGYILLSNEYKNNKQQLNYACPKGHRHSTRWDNWVASCRCPVCASQGKPTIEEVKRAFEKENYILLDTAYKNNRTKLNYKCPKGHMGSTSWGNWKSLGNRCGHCAKNVRHNIEYAKTLFEREGYTLSSTEYKNNRTKLDYICFSGHKNSIRLDDWKRGYRCPTCHAIKISGSGNHEWQGGVSYEPYCPIWKDKEYKDDIKTRDGHKCLNPCCDSNKPNDLTIHHIGYDKKNCQPSNLITLCRVCNIKANTNRDWHKGWYQAVLTRRYNYKY